MFSYTGDTRWNHTAGVRILSRIHQTLAGVAVSTALAASSLFASAEESSVRIYVGTYTGSGSEGIYLAEYAPESQELVLKGVAAKTENPSFLAQHPSLPVLYAVGESGGSEAQPEGTVSAFRMDTDGALTPMNQASSGGVHPCHLAVAPDGKHLAVANYSSGSVALFPIKDDGSLVEASYISQHTGSSVNPDRQEGPHAHSVDFDRSGKYLFSADLGLDKLFVYRYLSAASKLEIVGTPTPIAPAGSGPRHVALHPDGRNVFVVNELSNTVTRFQWSEKDETLRPLQTIGTLPVDFTGTSHCAEILAHPSGELIVASNRGHDSLALLVRDTESGDWKLSGTIPTGGKTPRHFTFSPKGDFVLAANQETGNITHFVVEGDTLKATGKQIEVPKPVCVLFVR